MIISFKYFMNSRKKAIWLYTDVHIFRAIRGYLFNFLLFNRLEKLLFKENSAYLLIL